MCGCPESRPIARCSRRNRSRFSASRSAVSTLTATVRSSRRLQRSDRRRRSHRGRSPRRRRTPRCAIPRECRGRPDPAVSHADRRWSSTVTALSPEMTTRYRRFCGPRMTLHLCSRTRFQRVESWMPKTSATSAATLALITLDSPSIPGGAIEGPRCRVEPDAPADTAGQHSPQDDQCGHVEQPPADVV